ncbi:MAG: DUF4251 domain-containing protein [Chitinophagales bacterium]
MKNINNSYRKIFLFSFFALMTTLLYAQGKQAVLKNSIEARQFIFHAQTALPLSGPSRQLSSEYDLNVSENSIVSYLPFFGRAYSLPYNSTEGGFNFTSAKFDYTSNRGKKGGWEINIKPKDVKGFREFNLSISENGYGTLQVMSNNRQPISFTGYVTPVK